MACSRCCLQGRAPFCHHDSRRDDCKARGCFKQGCDGFHPHPAVAVPNLTVAEALGRDGLNAMFPCGSLWHYGPIYENMEALYRVVPRCEGGKGAYHSGTGHRKLVNHSRQPKDAGAYGKASWFIDMELVSSPFESSGKRTGLPPIALIPRDAVLAERGISTCSCCSSVRCCKGASELSPWEAERNALHDRIDYLSREVTVAKDRAAKAEAKVRRIKQALTT